MAKKKQANSEVVDSLVAELDERMGFFLVDSEDSENMRSFREVAEARAADVIDPMYEHFFRYQQLKDHFQSDEHLATVKKTQHEYLKRLFDGIYDENYGRDRFRVGFAHERIGLEPVWYIGAYNFYLARMQDVIFEHFENDPEQAVPVFRSVLKMVLYDVSIAIDTYIGAMRQREIDTQQRFVGALTDYSRTLNESSSGILEATSSQSAATQEQATSINEITTTLGELRQTSTQALAKAEDVVRVAERSQETSVGGSQAVEAAIQGMREIREQVESIAEKILTLSEQSQQIGEIITSVNEISEQSKLLALNAAIEAGRAGEHGKGFAVVATEIRSLADQSKQATAQVRQLLGEIQGATNAAVLATEEGTKKVESGAQLANRAGEAIHALSQSIEESSGAARLIANAARQQAAGIEQASDAMNQINTAVNDSAAALKQTESKSTGLTRVASDMDEVIESFKRGEKKAAQYQLA